MAELTTRIIKVVPFIGAGWAWPWVRFWKFGVGIYFHCGRGLYIGIGWSHNQQKMKRFVKDLTPNDRAALGAILAEALKKSRE